MRRKNDERNYQGNLLTSVFVTIVAAFIFVLGFYQFIQLIIALF